jgi:hypothetical protein
MTTTERNVRIDPNYLDGCYIITHADGHVSCYGFDNTLDEIERIVIELVGRGALPDSYLERELVAVKALHNLRDQLKRVCAAQNDRAMAGLSPQLIGLEDHRVEVTAHGETYRFIVGRSTGWMPCHLEIKRTDSSGGGAALREYDSVKDLGRVR